MEIFQSQEIASLVSNPGNKVMCHHTKQYNSFKINFPQSHHEENVHSLFSSVIWMLKNTVAKSLFSNATHKIFLNYSYFFKHQGTLRPQNTTWSLYFITVFGSSTTLNILTFPYYLYKSVAMFLVANCVKVFHCWDKYILIIYKAEKI